MSALWPRSLFGRTALLVAVTVLMYSIIVWQAVMWAVIVPSAQMTADDLAERAAVATTARRLGVALPDTARFVADAPADVSDRLGNVAYGVYLRRLRTELRHRLDTPDVVIGQARAPTQIWIRSAATQGAWLVLSSRLARPAAPVAVVVVLGISTLLILGVSGWSARRLTAPLGRLATAAARVAEGEVIESVGASGPSEVRSLWVALERMSHQLSDLNSERELMLAGISHDLRSPLARVRVALELLDARDRELANAMTGEVEEMDRMIGQFLHYVRAGYREMPVQAVLDDVVTDALKAYHGDPRVELITGAPHPQVLCIEVVRHVVINLVQNALEHGLPPVHVTTRQADGYAQILVRDAGGGISPEDWPRALRAFGRLDAPSHQGHSGLGLALVDRLVRAARGTLSAQRQQSGFVICAQFPTSVSRGPGTHLDRRDRG